MRIRSLLAMTTGAALGAGTMYLLDPEQGETRRREVRRTAWQELARHGTDLARHGTDLAGRSVDRASTVLEAAVYGYHAERHTPQADAPTDATGSRRP